MARGYQGNVMPRRRTIVRRPHAARFGRARLAYASRLRQRVGASRMGRTLAPRRMAFRRLRRFRR